MNETFERVSRFPTGIHHFGRALGDYAVSVIGTRSLRDYG